MRNDILPTLCLPFESASARSLDWLPLAVRYKLDAAGLRLTLEQWKALPITERGDLLRRLPQDSFRAQACKAGAVSQARQRTIEVDIDDVEVARILMCSVGDANVWLSGATSFALYVMKKRSRH